MAFFCPKDKVRLYIVDTRYTEEHTRRTYECPKCNKRMYTTEKARKMEKRRATGNGQRIELDTPHGGH